jgi:predicted nuclease of predicted toxin-antitoxin system
MHLLADENFPKPIIETLRAEGHDVLWARIDHAGAKDVVLLDLAEAQARIVLTLDKDFWHIAVQRRSPLERSGVVLFRVQPQHPRGWHRLYVRFSRRVLRGHDISASSRSTEFKWLRSAESESPFRLCILQLGRPEIEALLTPRSRLTHGDSNRNQ